MNKLGGLVVVLAVVLCSGVAHATPRHARGADTRAGGAVLFSLGYGTGLVSGYVVGQHNAPIFYASAIPFAGPALAAIMCGSDRQCSVDTTPLLLAGFAALSVVQLAGALLMAAPWRRVVRESVAVVPWVGPGAGGVAVGGRF